MDDILYAVYNLNTLVSKELIDKTRALSARSFAILVNNCRESNIGYAGLSRLFDMRSDFGDYARACVDAISFDVELNEKRDFYWPITEYILQTLHGLKPSDILKESAFANHLITPAAVKRRLDYFRIDSSGSFGYINDHVNESIIPTRTGIVQLKKYIIAKKPRHITTPDRQDRKLIEYLRSVKSKKGKIVLDSERAVVETLTEIAEAKDELVRENDTKIYKDHVYINDLIEESMSKMDDLVRDDEFNAKIYGPLNGKGYCVTGIGDGHRMLRCSAKCDNQSEIDDFECGNHLAWNHLAWYGDGICDSCAKKIRKPSYAIRFPRVMGGFSGKYCSWDCLRDYPVEEIDDMVEYRLQSLKDTLETFKIYS